MNSHVTIYKILMILFFSIGCQEFKVREPEYKIEDLLNDETLRLLDLDKFRGIDKNNNKLDDIEIEEKLIKLNDDPYVQKLLIFYAIQYQQMLENAFDLELVKSFVTESTKFTECFTMMYLEAYDKSSMLRMEVSSIVTFTEERKKLDFVLAQTMRGHSFRLAGPSEKMDGHDWQWEFYCPFEFKEGDKEKYYRPWKERLDKNKKTKMLK